MMSKTKFVVGMCVVFLFLGTQHCRLVGAAAAPPEPNACPQYQCKQISYFWDPVADAKNILGYCKAGTNTASNTCHINIYTPSSTFKGLVAKPDNAFLDRYTYASCTPSCGREKDANRVLVWQAKQEVSPSGAQSMKPDLSGFPRTVCTPTANNVDGPKNPMPVNRNGALKNSPPGW